jgi:hypothetical protein
VGSAADRDGNYTYVGAGSNGLGSAGTGANGGYWSSGTLITAISNSGQATKLVGASRNVSMTGTAGAADGNHAAGVGGIEYSAQAVGFSIIANLPGYQDTIVNTATNQEFDANVTQKLSRRGRRHS